MTDTCDLLSEPTVTGRCGKLANKLPRLLGLKDLIEKQTVVLAEPQIVASAHVRNHTGFLLLNAS